MDEHDLRLVRPCGLLQAICLNAAFVFSNVTRLLATRSSGNQQPFRWYSYRRHYLRVTTQRRLRIEDARFFVSTPARGCCGVCHSTSTYQYRVRESPSRDVHFILTGVVPRGVAHVWGRRVARALEAPSRARRFALALLEQRDP